MKGKSLFGALLAVVCIGAVLGRLGPTWANRARRRHIEPTALSKTLDGFKVRLVAVADSSFWPQGRLADHAWTPDGFPYEGPEVRLATQNMTSAPGGGSRRRIVFEIEQPPTTQDSAYHPEVAIPAPKNPTPSEPLSTRTVDVFSYLPDNGLPDGDRAVNPVAAGPISFPLWSGIPRDSGGNIVFRQPTSVGMEFGIQGASAQSVVFGISQGEFKVIAKVGASVAGLGEGQTAILASGPWGRIEATHLTQPDIISKPPATYRFLLLGGAFPPTTERKALFFDSHGRLVASCGDGPNNPGYTWPPFGARSGPADIATVEIQERPYAFVQFSNVVFDAPQVDAYSGQQGLARAADSTLGKVVGVFKPTKDGPWSGFVLYAQDGKRWLDSGQDLAGMEYGQFDPWNHPFDDRLSVLFAPNIAPSSARPPTTCELYAVDSPDGPRKERLTSWPDLSLFLPITTIVCNPTKRPYLRLEIRVGTGKWRTIETIAVTDRMHHTGAAAPPGTRVLEVLIHENGSIGIWKDEREPVPSRFTWRPQDQLVRAIAHLRDGRTIDADFNMAGDGGAPPNEDRYHGLMIDRQINGSLVRSGANNIDMKDIKSFELQAQDLRPAVTMCIHSPKD